MDNTLTSYQKRNKLLEKQDDLTPSSTTTSGTIPPPRRHLRNVSADYRTQDYRQNFPRDIINYERREKLNAVSHTTFPVRKQLPPIPTVPVTSQIRNISSASPQAVTAEIELPPNTPGSSKFRRSSSFRLERESENGFIDKMVDEEASGTSAYKSDLDVSPNLSWLPPIPENSGCEDEDPLINAAETANSSSRSDRKSFGIENGRIWNAEYEEFHMDLNNKNHPGLSSLIKPSDEGSDKFFEISFSFKGHSRGSTISEGDLDSLWEATEDSSTMDDNGRLSSRMRSPLICSRSPSVMSTYGSSSTAEDIITELARLRQQLAKLQANNMESKETTFLKELDDIKNIENLLPTASLRCRQYSVGEIEKATNFFANSQKLGQGMFGSVYRGVLDYTIVAVKVLSDADKRWSHFQHEVEMLWRIRHPNIVMLLGACPELGCIVYEYMANGSVEDRLFCKGSTPPLTWFLRFKISWEVATGLHFLHSNKPEPIVHRDLKPSNILLDQNYISKIGSVALARLIPSSAFNNATQYRNTSVQGTFSYIDPEYQRTGILGTKSDLYALGVIILQLLTAKPPDGLVHTVERSMRRGNFAEVLDQKVKNWPVEEATSLAHLALRCCALRRKDRPDLTTTVLPQLQELKAFADRQLEISNLGKGKSHMKLPRLFSKKSQSKKNAYPTLS